MQFSDEHKNIIMDHHRNPRHKSDMSQNEMGAKLDNPSCGDRIALKLDPNGDTKELLFDGEGCAFTMASASIMADLLSGKTFEEAKATIKQVLNIFDGQEPPEALDKLGDIQAFTELIDFPVRLKCATLPWQTAQLLFQNQENGQN